MAGNQTGHSITAYMIAFDDEHQELIFPVDSKDLRAGDLLLLKTGEAVPADCKILSGEIRVRGSADGGTTDPIVGEPDKGTPAGGDLTYAHPLVVPRGSLITSGTAKAYVIVKDSDAN